MHLNATVRKPWVPRDAALLETGEYLKQAARAEPDAFNRFWFSELADKAVEKDRATRRSSGRFGMPNMFANMFANMFGADDEDFEDNFDEECGCPSCQAARQAKQAAESNDSNNSDASTQFTLF